MGGPSRVGALFEADRTLTALNINQDQPVDVFDAIGSMGLELVFADLDHLLGAVVPHGGGGVLITSQRSTAIQRYTAAHEIGHWVLHRNQLNMDGEVEILGVHPSERERQAQLFAAYFLMPPPLVMKAINRYGLRRGEVTPAQVYLVSRYMGVSFEATARRLETQKVLSAREVASLRQSGRLAALRAAFDGRRPRDGSADLWDPRDPLDQDGDPSYLVVEERDEVIVELPENRSSGWQWMTPEDLAAIARRQKRPRPIAPPESMDSYALRDDGDARSEPPFTPQTQAEVRAALQLVPSSADPKPQPVDVEREQSLEIIENGYHDQNEPTSVRARAARRRGRVAGDLGIRAVESYDEEPPRIGATGLRTIVLRCAEVGRAEVQLHYAHAFDPGAEPAAVFELIVDVRPTPLHEYRLRVLATDIDVRLDGDPADDAVFEVAAT